MPDIEIAMQKLCDAGARAMRRYAEVAGESPDDMPEFFMPAFVLDHIGKEITATLETRFSKLFEWNDDIRVRRRLPPRSPEEEAELLVLAEELGRPRVDMVLYEGDDEGRPKDKLDFLALLEFKKGWVPSDERTKLLRILPHIDTCPYGVVCGSVRGENLEWNKGEARKTNDRWYQSAMQSLPGEDRSYFFCARLFDRAARK
jgi:hypothetical protein